MWSLLVVLHHDKESANRITWNQLVKSTSMYELSCIFPRCWDFPILNHQTLIFSAQCCSVVGLLMLLKVALNQVRFTEVTWKLLFKKKHLVASQCDSPYQSVQTAGKKLKTINLVFSHIGLATSKLLTSWHDMLCLARIFFQPPDSWPLVWQQLIV